MLIRITECCRMGCSHCMIDATPKGQHMSFEMFEKAIRFSETDFLLIISGGEPLEHPNFFEFAQMIKKSKFNQKMVTILSNGMFLEDEELRERVLDLGFSIQITNDSRFYPRPIPNFSHPLICGIERKLRIVSPLGRAAKNHLSSGRHSPLCFNLRSVVRNFGNFRLGVLYLRSTGKFCTPSINVDGSISAGESNQCYRIGTVDSSDSELTNNLLSMQCNHCGLEDNLKHEYREAIGI